jgi:hypothetical protein
MPPPITHAQQTQLNAWIKGRAESIPSTMPPINAGFKIP